MGLFGKRLQEKRRSSADQQWQKPKRSGLVRLLMAPFFMIWRPFEMLRRKLGLNPNYMIVIVLVLLFGGWMLSGMLFRQPPEPPSAEGRTNDLAKTVLVRRPVIEETERAVRISGKTREERKVDIKAELSGTVEEILAEEGDLVEEGFSMIRLEQDEANARLAKAEAQEKKARLEYRSQVNLRAQKLSSATEAAQAEANYEDAKATATLARKQFQATEVRAPFAGTAEQIYVEQGDFVQPGQLLASVYDYSPMLVVGALSELEVSLVKVGALATIRPVNGDELTGTVRYVSSLADENSRTFEVKVEVDNSAGDVLAGLTAEIDFRVERVMAVKITPALLTINDGGKVGVKVVQDGEDIVRFAPVEVIKAETNEMWVAGIAEGMRLITRGFGFVEPGDKVDITEEQS